MALFIYGWAVERSIYGRRSETSRKGGIEFMGWSVFQFFLPVEKKSGKSEIGSLASGLRLHKTRDIVSAFIRKVSESFG